MYSLSLKTHFDELNPKVPAFRRISSRDMGSSSKQFSSLALRFSVLYAAAPGAFLRFGNWILFEEASHGEPNPR